VLTETVGFRAVFVVYAAAAAMAGVLGFSVHDSQTAHNLAAAPESVKGFGLGAMIQRLRGLKNLFYQIEPHLRATYLVVVFAHPDEFRSPSHNAKHAAAVREFSPRS
jgi:hypothetical protein